MNISLLLYGYLSNAKTIVFANIILFTIIVNANDYINFKKNYLNLAKNVVPFSSFTSNVYNDGSKKFIYYFSLLTLRLN